MISVIFNALTTYKQFATTRTKNYVYFRENY